MDLQHKFKKATQWKTAVKDGGVKVVDDKGDVIETSKRYIKIISQMQ